MTVGGFISMISEDDSWISGEDFGAGDDILLRKNCARIIHRYLQKVLREPDEITGLPSPAEVPDLNDCRICAPHIAQVIAKGIMSPRETGPVKLFGGDWEVDADDARIYIGLMYNIKQE